MKKIIVDIYGADNGAELVVKGIARSIKEEDIFPVLVGSEALIDKIMSEMGVEKGRYQIIDTEEYITNSQPPTCIFGGCDNASMALALGALKADDEAVALLSPGNTGALLVGSICRLGLLAGIKFPSLVSALPIGTNGKLLSLVDCGANVDCTASDIALFAKMGNVFARCYCGIEAPRVGLMSVGREAEKGNALTREAFGKIKELGINFIGNLEGSDMVSGYADVVVCDGFSGNILLKNTEAVGKKAMEIVSEIAKDCPEIAKKINDELFKTFDFNSQGAATFLGTKKLIVKMHGSANEETVLASVRQILRLDKADFSGEMAKVLKQK